MKLAVRGKYLVIEHAVELRRIIPALPIVIAGPVVSPAAGGSETARAPAARTVVDVTVRDLPKVRR
jgi:hypothetical protein